VLVDCRLISVFVLLFIGLLGRAEAQSWKKEWEQSLEAAKREGQVAIYHTTGPFDALFREFQKRYSEIQVNGESFVRDLLKRQEVVVTGDNRQIAEWVIRGRYPIGIGVPHAVLADLRKEGIPVSLDRLKSQARLLTSGFGTVQLINRRPHPNASTLRRGPRLLAVGPCSGSS